MYTEQESPRYVSKKYKETSNENKKSWKISGFPCKHRKTEEISSDLHAKTSKWTWIEQIIADEMKTIPNLSIGEWEKDYRLISFTFGEFLCVLRCVFTV